MAAITNAGSGNWNSTTPNSPWSGGTVPSSTDTITIANGTTLTVPAGYTAECGDYPADDTGTPALKNTNASGTGILIVNGTFKYKGPVRQSEATWTVGAGGTITYDASGAATPATALYSWQIGQQNGTAAKLLFNGSSGSRCTVNSVGNVQSGVIGNVTSFQGGGQVRATFTDFSYIGAASTSGNAFYGHLNTGADFHLEDCTLDHCAQIQMTGPFNTAAGIASTAIFRLLRTKFTNPANTNYTIQVLVSSGNLLTSGERRIERCIVAGQIFLSSSDGAGGASQSGFTFKYNMHRCRDLSTGAAQPSVVANGATGIATWDQNLAAIITAGSTSGNDPGLTAIGNGTYSNTYLFRLTIPGASGANTHPCYLKQALGDITLSGWIIQLAHSDTMGDMVNMTLDAASARNITIQNSLYLPNSIGTAAGSFLNQQGSVTQTNTKIYFNHNTCAVGVAVPNTGVVWGVGTEGGTTWPSGTVPSIQSNIAWNPVNGAGTLANSSNTSTVNANAVTAADYNCTSNVSSTIYGNPAAQFAGTPGTHDIAANPNFVDSSRSLLYFDQGYLGAPVGTAWVTSTAYAVGDIVSVSDSGWFSSQTQNWRCVVAHTSGSTTKPETGATFPANWEPACLKTIEDDLIAGTTYTYNGVSGLSLVGVLVAWTKAGFAPTNSALKNAGHDGTTIGAVEGIFGHVFRPSPLTGLGGAGQQAFNPSLS